MKSNEKIIKYVNDIRKGNEEAFSNLYEESYKYLHTCVIHIVKDEEVAQDMLQDTYMEIFKNLNQLQEAEGFLGWAATIANRKCFAYLKKNKDVLVDEQTDDEGNTSDYFENIADDDAFIPENIFDNREKVNIIRGIIDELTDVQRACVIGFYYNDRKQDQIAEELGIPVNTVKSHLNRAKSKIKEAVGDIEKKQGIKLLAVLPFMAALFGFETEAYAAEGAMPAMSEKVAEVITSKASISAGSATKAAETAAKSVGMAAKTKIAIGVAAGIVCIGVIAGIVMSRKTEGLNAAPEKVAQIVAEALDEGVIEEPIDYTDTIYSYDDNVVEEEEIIPEITEEDYEPEEVSANYYWITLWYEGDGTVDKLYYKMSEDADWIFVGDIPLVAGDGYDVRVSEADINGYMAIKSVVGDQEYISESNDIYVGYCTFGMWGSEPHYAEGDSFDYVNAYFELGGGIAMEWY